MRFRGVLLSFAVLYSALPCFAVLATPGQTAPAARQARPRVAPGPFGIPFPASRDPLAWQAWRQRVQAELQARRSTHARANANGSGSNGIIETIAGAAPFQKPVNALQTGFGRLQGIAEDGSGNLYVASCDLGVVLKVDTSSNTTIYAGQPLAAGPVASAGDGGPATSARVPCPTALVVDATGNLYISDTASGTVRVVDAGTGVIHTIAGALDFPIGLTLDGNGHLFIEDLHDVQEVDLTTGLTRTIAGSGPVPGQTPCFLSAAITCPATQVDFEAFGPTIAFARGHLYVALNSVYVNGTYLEGSIVSIDLSSGIMQLIAGGWPNAGTSSTYPGIGLEMDIYGLAADAAGNLYISVFGQPPGGGVPNQTPSVPLIEELSASDHTLDVIAGNGGPYGYSGSGDGGAATTAGLAGPAAICLSPMGSVVFADVFRIRSFAVGGNIGTIAGVGPANYFGDNGAATQAGLDQPSDVAADALGNLYVADLMNSRVRRIDAVTGVITTVAGGGASYGTAADGGSALQAGLFPTDVALDGSDHLYVRDFGGLRVVDLKTGVITTLLPNVVTPGSMVFDGDKTLYIANSHLVSQYLMNDQVWALDLITGTPTVIAGDATPGQLPTGDGGPAVQASLRDVRGLALDGQGNLYLADRAFYNVRRIDLKTGIIQSVAGTHSNANPLPGYSGDGGPAVDALVAYPTGLAYDGAGHLILADSGNDVLRQIDLTTNIMTTVAGNHVRGFGGDGAPATGAMFYFPEATTLDTSGNPIIADTYNNRVRRVVLHPTNLKATLTYGAGSATSGESITFTATYNGLSFGLAPTGTVTFLNGSTSLGTGTIAAATDGSGNYVATLTTTSLPTNGATISAQYSGDVHYAAATTTIAFQQLTPSYTVSAKPASLTVKQGSSGSITFTVTPQNGFSQAVMFGCDSATLPKGVTCSFNPASVTPNGSAVTTTLTVATTAASIASLNRQSNPLSGWLPRSGATMALVLLVIPSVRRRGWLGGTALLLLCVSGMTGCGGGGSNSTGGVQNANATPAGSYSIHITTSATSGSGAVTVALTVTE